VRRGTIVVCADDFGLSEAVSAAIAELLRRGAVNATSCLTDGPAWSAWAGELREIAAAREDLSVGLHLDPPSPWASIGAAGRAFERQWRAFEQALGRAPDFVDGHRHAHLFPGPRRALFRLLAETGARPWLRQCRTTSRRGNWKRLVLDPLSAAFEREARARGYAVNPGFGGLRRFDPREDMAEIWRRDLAAMIRGGVLMVHPGRPDPADPLSACRAQEAALLTAGAVDAALAACGKTMGAAWGRPAQAG
jgi:hypothetical protein